MGAHKAVVLTAAVPLAAAVIVNAIAAGAPLPPAIAVDHGVAAGALLAAPRGPRHHAVVGAVLPGVVLVAPALLAAPVAILFRPAGRSRAYICNRCGEPKKGHWCNALYK